MTAPQLAAEQHQFESLAASQRKRLARCSGRAERPLVRLLVWGGLRTGSSRERSRPGELRERSSRSRFLL